MTRLVPRDRRTAAATVIVALLLALLPTPGTPAAHADGSSEAQLHGLLSDHRAANGRGALQRSGELAAVARRHAQRMADGDHLHHNPDLGGSVSNWDKVGENVGRGPDAAAIQGGWRNSGSHDANMLDGDWVEVGIGAVVKDGQLWAVQVFRVPRSEAAAEPEPAPAADPQPAPAADPAPAPASAAEAGSAAGSEPPSEPTEPADGSGPDDAPEPEPHAVPELAPGADQLSAVLARLEAREA